MKLKYDSKEKGKENNYDIQMSEKTMSRKSVKQKVNDKLISY